MFELFLTILLLSPLVPSRVLLVSRPALALAPAPALAPLAVAVVGHAPQQGRRGAPRLVRLQLLLLQQ